MINLSDLPEQEDTLVDGLIDLDKEIKGYDRATALDSVTPDDAKVGSEKTGGYQGDVYIVIKWKDRYFLTNDYYGSCAGCDAFLADKNKWIRDCRNKIKQFADKESAISFIKQEDIGFDWTSANTERLIGEIKNI